MSLKNNPELLEDLKTLRHLAKCGITHGMLFFYARHSAEEKGATDVQIEAFIKEGIFEREQKLG